MHLPQISLSVTLRNLLLGEDFKVPIALHRFLSAGLHPAFPVSPCAGGRILNRDYIPAGSLLRIVVLQFGHIGAEVPRAPCVGE